MLSDPARRRQYDSEGPSSLNAHPLLDPSVVFSFIFGEDKFRHLVGDLAVALTRGKAAKSPAALLEIADGSISPAAAERDQGARAKKAPSDKYTQLQTAREVRLAKLLAGRLDTYLAEPRSFAAVAEAEAKMLSRVNLGPQMLKSVGIMYEQPTAHTAP